MTAAMSEDAMTVDAVHDTCGCPRSPSEPSGTTRRSVLRAALATGALTAVSVAAQEAMGVRYAFGATAPAYTGDVLVVLSLRGGFDGLSAVVPVADPDYLQLRPTVGIPAAQTIPLTRDFGLHPALAPLLPLWKAGTFGAVHAVGQADASRSHFEAMAEMERAAPSSALRTGWIDRAIGLRSRGTVFQAAQVGQTGASPALLGPVPELAMRSVDGFALSGAWDDTQQALWTRALTTLHKGSRRSVGAPATAALGALKTTARLKKAGYTPAGGVTYPAGSRLADALRDVARLIKAQAGLQVACIDVGDWDMHVDMGTAGEGWMHDKLADLASALAAFAADLGPGLDGVTVVTLSEFGRRVQENGSGGVDHGHGNAVLLLGGGVAGGTVHGRWPGLSKADLLDGDLAGVVDYRQLLAEILQKRCRLGSVAEVFPGLNPAPLGVVTPRS